MIDIIVLLAVTFLLDAVLGAFVQVPIDLEKGFVLDAIVKVLLVGVGCGLVLLRGERLADIGLKRPESWTRTLIIGVGLAAIVFVAMYLSEKAGFRRDLSKFKDVQGNPELAFVAVLYALIGAGFYEEFTFRGFLMQGLAMLFGGKSRRVDRRLYSARGALRSSACLPESARHRDHRHTRHFDGTAGSCVGAKSLGRDHRTRAFRRESFCFVLLSRAADWLISFDRPSVPPNRQRFNRRESNRYSTGWLILIFLKSGCLGFNKKFISLALSTLGTARATDFPARTHSSPICIV